MIDTLNTLAMLATIGFGVIGWIAPRYTMAKLRLATDGSTVGLSEIRAANGALFVAMAGVALLMDEPLAYAMVGFAYAGAAVGRLTSIVIDRSGAFISWSFFSAELALSVFLIWANTGSAI